MKQPHGDDCLTSATVGARDVAGRGCVLSLREQLGDDRFFKPWDRDSYPWVNRSDGLPETDRRLT